MSLLTDSRSRRSEHDRRVDLMREDEYRAHSASIDRYLTARFGTALSSSEREELRQDAFMGVEGARAKGTKIDNLEALLITSARNAAYGLLRSADRRRRRPFDPQDSAEARMPDSAPPLDVAVVDADENRRLKMLMGQLDERSRNVLKLRLEFGLDAPEIAEYLGVSKSHAYKLLKRAGRALSDSIAANDAGAHSRQQRALLTACEMGVATADQRRQAAELLEDPHARALLAELRGLGRQAAALMPLPATAVAGSPTSGRVSHMLWSVKQQIAELAGRTPGQDAVSQIAAGGGVRGSGAAVVAVTACLGVTAGVGVGVKECIDHGLPTAMVDVLPGAGDDREKGREVEAAPAPVEQLTTPDVALPPANPEFDDASTDPEAEPSSADSAAVPATANDSLSGLSGNSEPAPAPAPVPPPVASRDGGGGSSPGSAGAQFGGL